MSRVLVCLRSILISDTLKQMRKRKRYVPYILISLLSIVGFLLFVNTFSPTQNLDILFIKIPTIIPFFSLILLTFTGIFSFMFANSRRGLFVAFLIVSFLILQFLHINNIFYTMILISIFLLLEYVFWNKR